MTALWLKKLNFDCYVLEINNEEIKSLNLEKENSYTGVLKGIKGQYLLFEDQTVFNVRSNEGLLVKMSVN